MIKRTMLLTVLLFACLLQLGDSTAAQSKGSQAATMKSSKAFDKFFAESSAQYWVGVAMDYRSSLNHREANPLFRNTEGRINWKPYMAINSGLFAVTVCFQHKYPQAMNWVRRASGWLHIGIAIRNFNLR